MYVVCVHGVCVYIYIYICMSLVASDMSCCKHSELFALFWVLCLVKDNLFRHMHAWTHTCTHSSTCMHTYTHTRICPCYWILHPNHPTPSLPLLLLVLRDILMFWGNDVCQLIDYAAVMMHLLELMMTDLFQAYPPLSRPRPPPPSPIYPSHNMYYTHTEVAATIRPLASHSSPLLISHVL